MLELKNKRLIFSGNNYLLQLIRREVRVLHIDSGKAVYQVNCKWLGVSRDGEMLLLLDNNNQLQILRTSDGNLLNIDSVVRQHFDVDQRTVVTGSLRLRHHIELWDVFTPRKEFTVFHTPDADSWALHSDGQHIALTELKDAAGHEWADGRYVNMATDETLFHFSVNRFATPHPFMELCSPQNVLVVESHRNIYNIISLATGDVLMTYPINGYFVRVNPVDYNMVVQQTSEGIRIHTHLLKTVYPVNDVAFSPDGTILAALTSDKKISIFSSNTLGLIKVLE
jgi:WD40 repeat protein